MSKLSTDRKLYVVCWPGESRFSLFVFGIENGPHDLPNYANGFSAFKKGALVPLAVVFDSLAGTVVAGEVAAVTAALVGSALAADEAAGAIAGGLAP